MARPGNEPHNRQAVVRARTKSDRRAPVGQAHLLAEVQGSKLVHGVGPVRSGRSSRRRGALARFRQRKDKHRGRPARAPPGSPSVWPRPRSGAASSNPQLLSMVGFRWTVGFGASTSTAASRRPRHRSAGTARYHSRCQQRTVRERSAGRKPVGPHGQRGDDLREHVVAISVGLEIDRVDDDQRQVGHRSYGRA